MLWPRSDSNNAICPHRFDFINPTRLQRSLTLQSRASTEQHRSTT